MGDRAEVVVRDAQLVVLGPEAAPEDDEGAAVEGLGLREAVLGVEQGGEDYDYVEIDLLAEVV